MPTRLRHRYALAGSGLFALMAFLAGCAQPVREDRSIHWSKEGGAVGFQHGHEGVFLADKDGRKLTRIFQPDAGVIATSTPLWDPAGKRVLFTTARSPGNQPPVDLPFLGGEQDPAGNVHFQHEIVYTCWLYEQADGGKQAEPVALFEATADHPGYVAANLVAPLLQDLYVAEVFLSLDAAQDGEAFFRAALRQADTDVSRLSRAIALGQILLLAKKHQEYADLATETIAPLLTRVLRPVPADRGRDFLDLGALTEFLGGLALLPLGAPDFLARLPDKQLRDLRPRWEKLHGSANDVSRPLLDLVLHGLYQALGREKERQEVATRLRSRPHGNTLLPLDGEVGKAILTLHAQMRDLVRQR